MGERRARYEKMKTLARGRSRSLAPHTLHPHPTTTPSPFFSPTSKNSETMHRAGGRALAALAMRALAGGEPALAAASTSARALLARAPAAATTTLLHSTTSREWPAPAARTFSSSAPDPPPSPAAKNHTGWGQTKVQELLDFKVRGGKRNKK